MTSNSPGLFLREGNPDAIAACRLAGLAFLSHRNCAQDHLADALRCDPDIAEAHVLSGLLHILMARTDTLELARRASQRTRVILDRRERHSSVAPMVTALALACDGYWRKAADVLEQALDQAAPDPVLVKITHLLRFMSGDAAGMLSLTQPFADRDGDHAPGFGFILGCHAFALEENGLLVEAEEMAQLALHRERDDVWAMHALAHVYDVSNRTGEGLLWVESGRQHWAGCNNFASHMCWHLALFNLDRGRGERALEIYDRDIAPNRTEDFRDFANAVSLLTRLQQMGVDTGPRMEALHGAAVKRLEDTTYVFASLHYLLPVLAHRDSATAERLIAGLEKRAAGQDGDQSCIARDVGVPLARMLAAAARDKERRDGLVTLAKGLPGIGGSVVQRDLFLRSLILMADDVCDHKTTNALLAQRSRMRQEDAFARMMDARMCFGGSAGSQHVA